MDRLSRFRRDIRIMGAGLPVEDMQAFLDAVDRRYEDLEYFEDKLKSGDSLMEEDIAEAAVNQPTSLMLELLSLTCMGPNRAIGLLIQSYGYGDVNEALVRWKKAYDKDLEDHPHSDLDAHPF